MKTEMPGPDCAGQGFAALPADDHLVRVVGGTTTRRYRCQVA
jgi:hypothetical protein